MRPNFSKHHGFFQVICAFGHFAGKPLRTTDAADVLTDAEVQTMRDILAKVANRLERERADWPTLGTLADNIRKEIGGMHDYKAGA